MVPRVAGLGEGEEMERRVAAGGADLDPQAAVAMLGQRALQHAPVADLMDEALLRVQEILRPDGAHILEWSAETNVLVLRAAVGGQTEQTPSADPGGGPSNQAAYLAKSATPLIIDDVNVDTSADLPPLLSEQGVRSVVSVVIGRTESPWGVLGAFGRSPGQFSLHDAHFLQATANVLAAALQGEGVEAQCQERLDRQRNAMLEALQSMAVALEARDPYTVGHQRRVAKLAVAIGEVLGLDSQRLQGIRLAGIVHNIGKVFLPVDILGREGPLNAIEFGLVKTHPQLGHDLLQGMEFPWPLAEIVFQHHERLDGSGYPRGLRDKQILPEARIITVADVVEAMVSDRRYRPARDIATALEEIAENKGRYYDPQVVEVCLELFREKSFDFD
jgi:GAF domain-containing protein